MPDVIILIAAQFDEMEVITCHAVLRDRHLAVVLVSVMPGVVRSIRGVTVHPDSYLSQGAQLLSETKRQVIILAGGERCAAQTLSDPRAHRLIQTVLAHGGQVGVMAKADFLVKETGLFRPEWAGQIVRQRGMKTAVFLNKLLALFIEK
ncbi:MAG: DJ-1/PfpI family protein [Anaerolineales bacterium]|nr:DJ-1/PfpI family protein [Anaerolineales bacterium]